MLELPLAEPTRRRAQLERPQEVARLLEVRSDSEDLMDQILHAHDAVLAQVLLHDLIVAQRHTLRVRMVARLDLSIPALVDELAHTLEVGVSIRHERFDDLKHLVGGLGEPDEDAGVDLNEAK